MSKEACTFVPEPCFDRKFDDKRCYRVSSFSLDREEKGYAVVVAEVSIIPLGTESPSVGRYVTAAIRELEASGLRCTPGPMGTTVEAETAEEVYAAVTRAQAAVFGLGVGRVYTILKMDDRRDVESRSAEEMVRSIREDQNAQ